MRFSLDNALGIHQQALIVRAQRAQVLANNLANADTPGYQARDLDFKAMLAGAKSATETLSMRTTRPGHVTGDASDFMENALYRIPLQSSIDGNTVDAQTEKAEFLQNAMSFQASFAFLNGKIRSLMTAIKGE
ncbi:MAG: flagellar basal body rod protein FlgB [Gammaproteobacteria bacterium]|nr:flagellar basal body rod protein FlgB [Gammaproteobacteria bacterium]